LKECFLSNRVTLIKKRGGHFTSREVDIISCIVNGRTARTTALLLKISHHTVNTHMKSIIEGIGGAQDQIIKLLNRQIITNKSKKDTLIC
jgi:DNA-binding NarL/FixJ family response regulator